MFSIDSVRSVCGAPGVRSALAVACGVVWCMPGLAGAQQEQSLEPTVVTATRTPTRISDLVADVTVIESEQIRRATGQTLSSVLARAPGVQFSSNGGLGKNSSVFIRGGEFRHTLVLVDGVRLGSATTGAPALDNLPLDQIERIEIVRGPLASLYGSEAAAGVIQIFTRRGRQGLQTSATVSLGSDDYYGLSTGVSGGAEALTFSVNASKRYTAGFSATNPTVGGSYNPDRDGFEQKSLSMGAGYAISPQWRVDGQALRAIGVSEFDDGVATSGVTPNTRSLASTGSGGVKLTGNLTEQWQTRLSWSRSMDRGDTRVAFSAFNIGVFETVQTQWVWDQRITSPVGTFLVSLEEVKQTIDSTVLYPIKQRTVQAGVLGWSGVAGPSSWQASARRDRNSQFGSEDTGAVSFGYDVSEHWQVGVGAGTSFVAPSFNQLYWPGFGKPDLLPERGRSKEASLSWRRSADLFKVVYFENVVRDFIQSGVTASSVKRVTMRGWTVAAEKAWPSEWGAWRASGSLDILNARDSLKGLRLRQRPDTTLKLDIGLTQGAVTYAAYMSANDGAFGDVANTQANRLPGYALLGAAMTWAFKPAWQLALNVDNLTDRHVQTANGYNQPRRQFMVTMSYSPK